MDKDAIRKMLERGASAKEIKTAVENLKKEKALAESLNSSAPDNTVVTSHTPDLYTTNPEKEETTTLALVPSTDVLPPATDNIVAISHDSSNLEIKNVETTPSEPEILSDQITFTNKELFGILERSKSLKITNGFLSAMLKITPELASEIIEVDLKHVGQSGQPVIKEDNTVNIDELEKVGQSLYRHNEMEKVYYLSSLPIKTEPAPSIESNTAKIGATTPEPVAVQDTTTPNSVPNQTNTATPDQITNGPLPETATAGERPDNNIELKEKNETLARMGASIKNQGNKIWSNSLGRKAAILTLCSSVLFVGFKIVESKNETQDTKENTVATAPASPQKIVSNTSVTASPQNIINQEILNKDYEKTRWWKDINPDVQVKIKNLINSANAEEYTLQFLNEIEILNTPGKITPSQKTKIELYKNISQYPNFLNSAYSGNGILLPECVIVAQDDVTKETKTCYLRNNAGELASALREMRSLLLGKNRYEPFTAQQTLPASIKEVKDALIQVINTNTSK